MLGFFFSSKKVKNWCHVTLEWLANRRSEEGRAYDGRRVMKWRNKASFFQFIRSCWYFKRNEITRWRIAQFIRLVTRREASGVSRQSVMQIDGKCHEPKTLHFSLCDKIISLSTKFCFIFSRIYVFRTSLTSDLHPETR